MDNDTREPTKIPGIYRRNDEWYGGSLRGYVAASYRRLQTALGDPIPVSDGYKVSTEWLLELEDGTPFTLYDYKMTQLFYGKNEDAPTVAEFRSWDTYEWHVGGEADLDVALVIVLLRRQCG